MVFDDETEVVGDIFAVGAPLAGVGVTMEVEGFVAETLAVGVTAAEVLAVAAMEVAAVGTTDAELTSATPGGERVVPSSFF